MTKIYKKTINYCGQCPECNAGDLYLICKLKQRLIQHRDYKINARNQAKNIKPPEWCPL